MSSSFKQTGVTEMRQAIERFSADQTTALRGVAKATAGRIHARAQQLLLSQLKTTTTRLAAAITIEEDADLKQFAVVSRSPVGQPTNLNIWNEHGTMKMSARPYMRPSADAEKARYRSDMEAAAVTAARETFGA